MRLWPKSSLVAILQELYDRTGGPQWQRRWDVNNECTWEDVVCAQGSIIKLFVIDNSLSGDVPGDLLQQLSNLTHVDLSINSLTGTLPIQLARCLEIQLPLAIHQTLVFLFLKFIFVCLLWWIRMIRLP